MNYTHLTREERYQIHALRSQGIGIAAIAAQLGRHRSTVDRELVRLLQELHDLPLATLVDGAGGLVE